jgi:hypothetical protein
MPKSTPMTDDALIALTDSEMRTAVGYGVGKMAGQRQKALVYYFGLPELDLSPPEIDGRSKAVSPDVRNTIESMLPQLMVKFAGSDLVVEFESTKPGDEPKAEQATDYINHLYGVKNHGERITYDWMKDALLSKNGIIKAWWDSSFDEKREEYKGMSEVELAMLMEDEEIEVTEQKSYPDEDDVIARKKGVEQLTQQLRQAMQAAQQDHKAAQEAQQLQAQLQQIGQMPQKLLYDVTCKRIKKAGRVRVENIPPEEFLISRDAKSISEARFCGHRFRRTRSQLKSQGYKNVDNLAPDEYWSSNLESLTRKSFDDEYAWATDAPQGDNSQSSVWVTECYVRCDYDGDGIAELRKVTRAGSELLDNEIVDEAPFISITPVPMPHRFFGLSVADLAEESQRVKTSILRGMLDNMYLQINGRYFAVDGQVNLDDLLTSRPGGVVRMKQAGMAGRLDQGAGDNQVGMGMMEYMQGYLEDSTGWTRYNQGSDGDSLNQTATGVNMITNRADMRLDLIARNFATGFRDLFKMLLKLASQNNTRPDVVRLRGKWVEVDPREWRNGFDVTVNVGIGTGNKDQQVSHLMALLQQQQFGLQIGSAKPQNVFEAQKELAKALGFKNGDKFFSDPSQNGPIPDPNQAQMQAQMQIEQAKLQASGQIEQMKMQAQSQIEHAKMQAQQQVDINRQRAEAEQHQMKVNADAQLLQMQAQQKHGLELERIELERWKAKLASDTQIYVEQLKLGAASDAALRQDAAEYSQEQAVNNDAEATE